MSGTGARHAWEIPHRVHQVAAHLERTGDWARRLPGGPPSPRVHFGPIAAGEITHYSAVSDARQWLREHYSDAVAVEMEAAGVAQAGHLNDALPTVMVRGISDYADQSKSATDDAAWQPRAADNAAAFAVALGAALAAELGAGAGSSSRPGGAAPAGGGPTNVAMGNARVGVQGGDVTIHGGIQLGGTDSSNGSSNGAASCAAESGQPVVGPDKLKLALDRARGLFRGLVSVATGVTAVMTAVRSLA